MSLANLRVLALCLPLFACGDDPAAGSGDTAQTTDAGDVSDPDGADLTDDAAPDPDDTADSPDSADSADTTTVRDWSAPGPYRVGFRTSSVTYDPTDGSAARTLRLVAWYPTTATTGDAVAYQGILPAPGVLGNAPPADIGPRPMLVFSHGNTSFAEQSIFLTEFFASHGYLVVAPDHTGNTFGSGGSVGIFHWRPDDLRGVLDYVEALSTETSPTSDPFAPLAAMVSDKIVVAGHSFGGYTALAAAGGQWDVDLLLAYCTSNSLPLNGCAAVADNEALYRTGFLDPRVDAIIPMTPGAVLLFGTDGLDAITVPTLLMTAAMDSTTPNSSDGDPAWEGLKKRAHNVRLDFATAGHFTFSDACSLAAIGVPVGEADGCGAGFIPPADAQKAINAYALAFAELHLAGDASGQDLLDGTRTIEPDITLSVGAD